MYDRPIIVDNKIASDYADKSYEDVVDYEVQVPLDYWEEGADIVPTQAANRVRQLNTYIDLYNGVYDKYFEEPLIYKYNLHKKICNRLVNFLMQYPPEMNFDYADVLSERFIQQLIQEIPNLINDMVRFGTGLLNVENGNYGAEVKCPLPIYWYPANEADAYLIPSTDKDNPHTLYINHNDGSVEIREYEYRAGKLGKRIGSTNEQFGDDESWAIIGEKNLGRISPMVNVATEPNTGDWGMSLYYDITGLVFEINRRFSGNSGILTNHGNPLLIFFPNDTPTGVSNKNKRLSGATADKAVLELRSEAIRLDTLRKTPVGVLPRGYEDLRYVESDGDLDDHFHQIDKVSEALYGLTHLPLTLLGLDGSTSIPASGTALRLQFMDTHSYIQKMQGVIIKSIKKALMIGALYNGIASSQLASFSDRIDIKWKNVFDETDESGTIELTGATAEVETEPEEMGQETPIGVTNA